MDLLFYRRELQCLVAIDLKIDDFKPEHLGKMDFYLEALDRDVKKSHENPSVGIILCKNADTDVVEYSLSRSLSQAMIAEYKIKSHVEGWAKHLKIENPYVNGRDFPQVSQAQRNVFHMRGYGAGLILDVEQNPSDLDVEIVSQSKQNYITITLEEVQDEGEFAIIPNAYKALMTYMSINGIKEKHDPAILSCYEHEYFNVHGVKYMDIYIAIE